MTTLSEFISSAEGDIVLTNGDKSITVPAESFAASVVVFETIKRHSAKIYNAPNVLSFTRLVVAEDTPLRLATNEQISDGTNTWVPVYVPGETEGIGWCKLLRETPAQEPEEAPVEKKDGEESQTSET